MNEKTTPDEPTRLTEGTNKSHTKDQQPNLSQTHNIKIQIWIRTWIWR